MRLKPAGIFIVVLIIAVLAYFAIKPKVSEIRKDNSTELPNTSSGQSNQTSGNNNTTATTTTTGNSEDRTFNYTPEKPQNGTLRGVVEVGATGFNSFVINMDNQNRWEIVSKDFGESLAFEGLATTEDIRAGLKKYLAQMFEKGVPKN